MKIILIVIDTLRSDHLSCYGYKRRTSPNIDGIASDGIVFRNFRAQCHWTIPTFTSIFTGLYPINHKMTWMNALGEIARAPDQLDAEIPLLPELLCDAGFLTAAVDNLINFHHNPNWFVRGYRYYLNASAGSGHGCALLKADEVNKLLLPWVEQHASEDFFLHVHYWDPHLPFNQPAPYDSMFIDEGEEGYEIITAVTGEKYVRWCGRHADFDDEARRHVSLYDGEIGYVDAKIGELIELLKEKGIYDDTLILITADHGEIMFELPRKGHHSIYEPLLRVPLIVKLPNEKPAVQASDALAQQIDIMPTILDIVGVKPPVRMDGRSLLPVIKGEADSVRDVLYHVGNRLCGVRCRAIRDERWKLIVNYVGYEWSQPATYSKLWEEVPERELYDLERDPEELRNLAYENREKAAELEAQLAKWIDSQVGNYLNDPILRRY